MSTILIRDSLRKTVEMQSGGLQTVIYTNKGQPSFVNIIEKYDLSEISTELSGVHPAFKIGDEIKDIIMIGTYQGVVQNGELLSLPNKEPTQGYTYDQYLNIARNSAIGCHVMTNAEWSAIALKCQKNNTQSYGNTYNGRSAGDAELYGIRVDGKPLGSTTETGRAVTFTGSGPSEWRHNKEYNGISDLVGNNDEFVSGLRLLNGEFQVLKNNDAALQSSDLTELSKSWMAIDGRTGDLIIPNGIGTTATSVKFSNSGKAAYTLVLPQWYSFFEIKNPSDIPVLAPALKVLQALCLYPLLNNITSPIGTMGLNSSGERLSLRGGRWDVGGAGGIFRCSFNSLRSSLAGSNCVRPAYFNI